MPVERASEKMTGPTLVVPVRSRFGELLSPFYRGRTIVIWLLWFCSAFVIYGLVSWLPTICSSLYDVPIKDALRFGLFTNMAGLAGTIACALLIDVVGRRRWFTFAFARGAVVLAILTTQLADVHKVVLLASVGYFFVNTTALVDGGINPHINGGASLSRMVNNEVPLTVSLGMAGPSQNGSPLSLS